VERVSTKQLILEAAVRRLDEAGAFMHTLTFGRTLTSLGFPDNDRWLDVVNIAAVAPLTPADHR
jgi:hypothetical protein